MILVLAFSIDAIRSLKPVFSSLTMRFSLALNSLVREGHLPLDLVLVANVQPILVVVHQVVQPVLQLCDIHLQFHDLA
jgi:hypothetical protein